uniref:Uncharacterized protein n=1 Tax=Rhizophora mucronata TaxID=61149 RepID=A0A2P2NGP3_RHIMU
MEEFKCRRRDSHGAFINKAMRSSILCSCNKEKNSKRRDEDKRRSCLMSHTMLT